MSRESLSWKTQMLINFQPRIMLSWLNSTLLGVDIVSKWSLPMRNWPRSSTRMTLKSKLPNWMPLSRRTLLPSIESKDSQVSSYLLEEVPSTMLEKEPPKLCLPSLNRSLTLRSISQRLKSLLINLPNRKLEYYSLSPGRILRTLKPSPVYALTMRPFLALLLVTEPWQIWNYLLILEPLFIEILMMVQRPQTWDLESVLMLLSNSLMLIDIQQSASLTKMPLIEFSESKRSLCSFSTMISILKTLRLSRSLPKRMLTLPMVQYFVYLKSPMDLGRDWLSMSESRLDQLLGMLNLIKVVWINLWSMI